MIILLMKALLIIIFTILATTLSLENYMRRAIYLGEQDNVCAEGQMSDMIQLRFNLDGGKKIVQLVVWGKTGCSQWYVENSKRIIPVQYWTYIDLPRHYLQFEDETTVHSVSGEVDLIFQDTSILNPARIDGGDYNCIIYGDGKFHHFGIKDYPGKAPPAIINFACDSLPSGDTPDGETPVSMGGSLNQEQQ